MARTFEKKPLYRKVNTRTHGVRHGHGGHARNDRNTKRLNENEGLRTKMRSGLNHGLDHTPLYRFLLKNVGQPWDGLHSEATSRLQDRDAIWHIVAANEAEERPLVWTSESSLYSGLTIDENKILRRVAPDITIEDLWPVCACCTHTFNGIQFANKYMSENERSIFHFFAKY